MADIIPNVVVSMPSQLFTLARSFKAAANGKIYIGKIDTDPTIPSNQIQAYLQNEDGSTVPVAQPILINAGGYPVYLGQIAKFVTVEGHSMAIYDAYMIQQFYFPNVLKYDPDQLRQQIEDPDGAVKYPSLQIARWRDDANIKGWGAAGDGVTNDTSAFTSFESDVANRYVNLNGATYLVDVIPSGNKYYNGTFKTNSKTYYAPSGLIKLIDKSRIVLAGNAGASIPITYELPFNQFGYTSSTVAMGEGALGKATKAKQTIAIGPDAMGNTLMSFENIAIGEVALQDVQSETDTYSTTLGSGTRNVGIGGNAGQKLRDGRNNVFVGRNCGTGAVSTIGVVSVGANALFGYNTQGWYPEVENYMPNNNSNTSIVAVGLTAGQEYQGINLTTIGAGTGRYIKLGQGNVLVGTNAGNSLEADSGFNGNVKTDLDGATVTSPYVKTGSNVVVTKPGHGAVVGGYASIYWSDGVAFANHGHPFPCLVTAVSGDTFTVQCPYTANGSGNCRVYWTTSLTVAPMATAMVIIGNGAGQFVKTGNNAVVVGGNALANSATAASVIAVGKDAARNTTVSQTSVIVGTSAYRDNPGLTGCSALGHNAGLVMQDGSVPTGTLLTSTCIGFGSAVSGNNQVQLGNSASTTYVYGTVQNRSDMRDKADWRDPEYSLDFVRGLRAREYRWDMRDDYIYIDDDGNVTHEVRDGSKKRERFHTGYLAQEVKELCDKLGVDFGGYQDHSIDGGCDVLSLGYDEFIPHVQKAVAMAWDKLDELESRIEKLEGK
jgi:trimeric autotransporter adhesin